MNIEVYDMLVFEDENSNIYQDCVCAINNDITANGYSEPFHKNVVCNRFIIDFTDDSFDKIDTITTRDEVLEDFHKFKLKEIWTRTDEDTYKKVWYDGDYYYNHLAKEIFKDIFQNVQFYSDPKIFEKISDLMDTDYDIFNIDFLNALKFCMASETKSIARKAASIYRLYKDAFDEVEKNEGI